MRNLTNEQLIMMALYRILDEMRETKKAQKSSWAASLIDELRRRFTQRIN